ncbi:MAG TPA: serine hydrolase [Acidimicrobiales bacterium]
MRHAPAARRPAVRRPAVRRALALLLGLATLVAPACTPGPGPGDPPSTTAPPPDPGVVYPGAEWERIDPAEAGFDPAALDRIAADAEAANSNCLVVTRRGRIVAEWYWNGTDASTVQEVFSVTKSVTSTLVGLAQEDGDLAVTDPAATYITEWSGTPSEAVTVEDLISNDSGRQWSLRLDYGDLVTARDRTGFAVGLGQDAPPGDVWVYNNAAIQTLDAVLARATGAEPAAYAEDRLFAPIGMADTAMTRDGAGNTNTFFGLRSTCEDLARFGYLFLRDGEWDGTQVVPEDWVEAATGGASQDINAAYGYLWWLNRRGPVTDPLHPLTREEAETAPDLQLAPGAPDDMYWARGLGGQVVQIDPGSETVVVRLGPGDAGADYTQADTARVVTEALVDRGPAS